ncbi:uracil permease [Ceratocystis pirilliformis]|uniref:Uracil permease n=1 Tax=Ceratocystis pirilliformis TaxID=259994 RepID=A0ABR3ZA38_9PEZI
MIKAQGTAKLFPPGEDIEDPILARFADCVLSKVRAAMVDDEGLISKISTNPEDDDTVFVGYLPFSTTESLHSCRTIQFSKLQELGRLGLSSRKVCFTESFQQYLVFPFGATFLGCFFPWRASVRVVFTEIPRLIHSSRVVDIMFVNQYPRDEELVQVELAQPRYLTCILAIPLINYDLKPVEQARRAWGPWNFVGFWIADSFNINTWMISSSMIVGGLSWWQSWLCVWIGYAISGGFICMTGRIGATYHIGFPVASRSSFGIWGSLWPVFNRAAMAPPPPACIWYGVQSYIGGHCVYLMIRSIWKSWDRNTIPNTFSESSGTTTADYASFFIFWLCSLPAIWFPVQQIRHLFTVKAFFVPCAGIGFLIWAVVRAGGIGPIIHQPSSLHGSDLAWEFVKGIMSSIANFATLIVNDPDFTRFAAKPKDAFLPQLISIPLGFGITSFIGIIVSSSSTVIYGDSIWDPLDLLERFIDDGGAGERFGVFIIAFAFALAQLGTNIAANSVSAGTDMTALLPRYLTIRRGGYICAAVGLAMCPYTLLTSSNKFTTYLSAYSVFLSSIAGVIVADYYIVRKGFLELRDLYSSSREGPYYYRYGVHWRAYVAYISGILINVVGFAGAVGQDVPAGAEYIYNLNFFAGFIVSAGMYWILCHFFPVPACSSTWMEINNDVENFTAAHAVARGGESYVDEGWNMQPSDEKAAPQMESKMV